MDGRDPRTGRFTSGNRIAVGNRGNRHPKWGNKNALVHGFYERIDVVYVDDDGWLRVQRQGRPWFRLAPGVFGRTDDGWWTVRTDVVEELQERGWL